MAGTPARIVDRIDSGPRFVAADVQVLDDRYAGASSDAMLRDLLVERRAGRVAVVSSFGAESAVLLHLIAQVDRSLPILFLDTGKHFAETLQYRDDLVARLGLTGLINLTPDAAVLAARDDNGLRWSYDPDGCCDIRKVAPLARALEGFDATISGRKGFQSKTRAGIPRIEIDRTDAAGRLKINPLADWDEARLIQYFDSHNLPPHPLVADGYPSIGCSPCTSRVATGEDPRSGRWKGWEKTECGIHGAPDVPEDPAFDPVF